MTVALEALACHCECHRRPQILPHRKPCCTEHWRIRLDGELSGLLDRQISVPEDHSSTTVPMPDRSLLLGAVREASEASAAARQRFITAVAKAHEAGITNQAIGMTVGLSEGGIRMLLKREFTHHNR